MHKLVINFARAVPTDSILDIHYVGLVEKVMYNRRDQIKCSVQDQEVATRLLDSIVVCVLVKLLELVVEDAREDAREVTLPLVLNIRVLHMDGAHCE